MKKSAFFGLAAMTLLASGSALAKEGTGPVGRGGVPQLDHIFVIMMENHLKSEIIGNPNAPFMTQEATEAGQALNYFGVGHPSLVNYLELVGGSNFGITNDNPLNWVSGPCQSNQSAGDCNGAVDPIFIAGRDVATPATAPSGGCNGQISFSGTPVQFNCALRDYASIKYTPKTIAHQLVEKGLSFKDYQESLPTTGPRVDGVYYADGSFSNRSPLSFFQQNPAPSVSQLYVTDHNPFVFFADIQQGTNPLLSEAQVVDWDGTDGLYQDLATGAVPNLAFIVPNKCHDIHTIGGQSNTCSEQQPDIQLSDAVVKKVVLAIKNSPVWSQGKSAIVILFDENDFSNNINNVPFIVDKNYGTPGVQSTTAYDHYSLLKTMEAAFGLPCLNNSCDSTAEIIDLFKK
ncbi:MAG TPA: alkaline phosphatase family protein [Aliidongia sp.]|nr:alkaline phosphatase family protein [Aliidongia sp.]